MTTKQARARAPLSVKCTRDELQSHAYSHAVLRFAGKIPTRMGATEALVALQRGVAALIRSLPDSEGASVLNPYVSSGKGTQPYAVVVSIVVSIDVRDTLLSRRSDAGWLHLPAPWGGQVALSPVGGGDLQEVHLRRLPLGFDLSLLQEKMKQKGIDATHLTHLIDPTTGFPRADAASALVPNGTQFPGGVFVLQKPDGSVLASVQVSSASRLPPAPGEEAAVPAAVGSYAAAAAAAAGAGITRPRPASCPDDASAGSAAAAAGQPAAEGNAAAAPAGTECSPQQQQQQQHGRTVPHPATAGGGKAAANQRPRSQPAARPRPAVGGERSDEQGSEAKRQCTEQQQPRGGGRASAGNPGGSAAAGGGGGGVATTNSFAQLSHSDDMDADAADLLAADATMNDAAT